MQNERSLRRKGNWDAFALATKLRVVFDASAKTSTGTSLNDTLFPGPSLYPRLTTVINNFRLRRVVMSADIFKMFHEIGLQDEEKDYHRLLIRGEDGSFQVQRMSRLTFGVKCSPYVATQVLLQVAEDHGEDYPWAAEVIKCAFYVDDCLVSANTLEDAITTSNELIEICSLHPLSWSPFLKPSGKPTTLLYPSLRWTVQKLLVSTGTQQPTRFTSTLPPSKMSSSLPNVRWLHRSQAPSTYWAGLLQLPSRSRFSCSTSGRNVSTGMIPFQKSSCQPGQRGGPSSVS